MVAAAVALQVAAVTAWGSHPVSQKNKKFSVATLTVQPGDKVVFTNDDEIIHNVFSTSKGFEFNLNAQKAGVSAEQAFATEGVAEVRCAFHPTMKLTITVKK
jgi:plastocyanin